MHPGRAPIVHRTQTVLPPTQGIWVDGHQGRRDEHGGRFTKTVEISPSMNRHVHMSESGREFPVSVALARVPPVDPAQTFAEGLHRAD